jgi:hypothetical protein
MEDTKAPNCRITTATFFIPRGAYGEVSTAVDFSDATSGFSDAASTVSFAGQASTTGYELLLSGGVPVTFYGGFTMGGTTASRADITFTVTDIAGNAATCKLSVQAK